MNVRAKLTSKGQITLPKQVRERYGLKTGDIVEFVERNGETVLKPRNLRAVDLAGILGPPPSGAKTLGEIKEGIEAGYIERGRRGLK